jgi:FkbM family methyltransferase
MQIEKINNFWVPSNDVHISEWKSGQPFTQNKCLNKFIEWCDKNNKKFNTVLDIGAWCGTWSKMMENYSNKIIAFEPDETHFACLEKNCTVNCEAIRQAVGNESKFISLTEDNFTQAKRVSGEGEIKMVTIDSLDYKDIDLIKIDVEGFEMEVLKGAKKVLETQCKFIMIELNSNTGKYGSSNQECMDFLRGLGFKLLLEHWPDKVFYRAN